MKRLLAALAASMLISSAGAQAQVHITVNRVIQGGYQAVSQATAGEELRYRAVVVSSVDVPYPMTVTVPLSENFLYAGSLNVPQGAEVSFSADGVNYPPQGISAGAVRYVRVRLPYVRVGETPLSFKVFVR